MKRYLIRPRHFDTRATLLELGQEEEKRQITNSLKIELGEFNFEQKLKNFKDGGIAPFSILSYHNVFFNQARFAFVHGYYYPALTAVCALGERILNHLILDLRDHFKAPAWFKQVHKNESFDDWNTMIKTLTFWNIFQNNEVKDNFKKLLQLRKKAIHFYPETYVSLRQDSLLALRYISKIINLQFGFLSDKCIPDIAGKFFLKQAIEKELFIAKYYLPQCPILGPYHNVSFDSANNRWLYFDWANYEEKIINDQEFASLYMNRKPEQLPPTQVPFDKKIVVQALNI